MRMAGQWTIDQHSTFAVALSAVHDLLQVLTSKHSSFCGTSGSAKTLSLKMLGLFKTDGPVQ